MNNLVSKFVFQHISEIAPRIKLNWLCNGILPKSGLIIIYGSPGSGKTFFVTHLGLSVASGLPIAGRNTKKSGVIYCAAEAGNGIDNRVLMAKEAMNLPDDISFSLLKVAPNLGDENSDANELIQAIRIEEKKKNTKYGVIILDTMARVIPGRDENSSRDAGFFVKSAEKLSQELNAVVIVVHHSGKNIDAGLRGSSAFAGAADTLISVKKASDYHWVQIEKQREGASDHGFSFKLKQVEVGIDDGEKITTCVVVDVTSLQESDDSSLNRTRLRKTKYDFKCNQIFNDSVKSDNCDYILQDGSHTKGVLKSALFEKFQASYPNNKRESNIKAFNRWVKASQEKGYLCAMTVDGADIIYKKP